MITQYLYQVTLDHYIHTTIIEIATQSPAPNAIFGRVLLSNFYTKSKFSTCILMIDAVRDRVDHATGGQCAESLDVSSDVGGIHCQNAAGGG
jgi:hypothetical protein